VRRRGREKHEKNESPKTVWCHKNLRPDRTRGREGKKGTLDPFMSGSKKMSYEERTNSRSKDGSRGEEFPAQGLWKRGWLCPEKRGREKDKRP